MIAPAPDRGTWRRLMRPALRVVDSLPQAGYGKLDFRFGGGTVLMLRFDHRISQDIDLFVDDAQALGFLSPRLNAVAAAVSRDYQEQANSVKLVLNQGDIDFIVAGTVTSAAGDDMMFESRSIKREATAEILAKKLLYRASSLKPRDAFDLASALAMDRPSAMDAIAATAGTHASVLRRLDALAAAGETQLLRDIRPTRRGRKYALDMIATVTAAIRTEGRYG